jgi:8-oxo-dGTP diphosphatase
MYVTSDAVTFRLSSDFRLEVLLVLRANEPYRGCWALPGGFVDLDEDLLDACARELEEETGLRPSAMVQLGAWGTPGRDPRGRNVTVAFLAVVGQGGPEPRGADDAARADWHSAGDLPDLAFDHAEILAAGLAKLRLLALSTHVLFAMLPESFGLRDVRLALDAVRGGEVTLEQAEAVASCARLEIGAAKGEGGRNIYRCIAPDPLAPLG